MQNGSNLKLPAFTKNWSKTRIICTIGPATCDADIIKQLIERGMSIARINHSHGDESLHRLYIEKVREVAQQCDTSVGILLDLAGPKYRIASIINDSVDVAEGETFVLTARQNPNDNAFSVWPYGIHKDVKVGTTILIDDAVVEAVIKKIDGEDIFCQATINGVIKSNKTVSIPDCDISLDYLTKQTMDGLNFAIEMHPEFVGLSCVRNTDDIETVRALLRKNGPWMPQLVSKIEMSQVLRELESVIEASDVVMVARGDLGIEIPLAELPVVQKRIIELSNLHGKQVITATQMLESMINNIRPTRAEVIDINAAVQQGTDAIMLSAETAIGKYPVRAMNYMVDVARNAENTTDYSLHVKARLNYLNSLALGVRVDDIIAYSAAQITQELGAKLIVAFTESGSSARRVSSFKPNVPIIAAVRRSARSISNLLVTWGVKSVIVGTQHSIQDMFYLASQIAYTNGYADEGELIVVVMGTPLGIIGNTNLVRVVRVHEPRS